MRAIDHTGEATMRARARTIDEAPARRTHVAIATLAGVMLAALGAIAAMLGSGIAG